MIVIEPHHSDRGEPSDGRGNRRQLQVLEAEPVPAGAAPNSAATDNVLMVDSLSVSYAGIRAVREFTFRVPLGGIVTIIGPNGAGKTSALRGVGGQVRASGRVVFQGHDVSRWPAHRISRAGLSQVPQNRRLFPELTVGENLELGAYRRKDVGQARTTVYELFPRLAERSGQRAGLLSGGEQQMLAIGRALMAKPTLIAMDEPSLGLSPLLVSEVFRTIKRIAGLGVSILLVEQNATQALSVSQYVYILNQGRLVHEGEADSALQEVDLLASYTQ